MKRWSRRAFCGAFLLDNMGQFMRQQDSRRSAAYICLPLCRRCCTRRVSRSMSPRVFHRDLTRRIGVLGNSGYANQRIAQQPWRGPGIARTSAPCRLDFGSGSHREKQCIRLPEFRRFKRALVHRERHIRRVSLMVAAVVQCPARSIRIGIIFVRADTPPPASQSALKNRADAPGGFTRSYCAVGSSVGWHHG